MTKKNKIENRGGVIIIIIIALLAIMKVIHGKLQEEIAIANFKHVAYSSWYNAKSIKQVLKENQRDFLVSLLKTDIVNKEKTAEIRFEINRASAQAYKYEEEKTEILLGSASIPNSAWSQDLDGELGKIIGLKKTEEISQTYSKLAAKIEIGILFLQISIVFGVLGLIISEDLKLHQLLIGLMIATAFIGIAICFYGYYILM